MGTPAIIKFANDEEFGIYVHYDGDELHCFVDTIIHRLNFGYRDKRPDDLEYMRMRLVDALLKEDGGYTGLNYGLRTAGKSSLYLEDYVYQIAYSDATKEFYQL